MTNAAGKSYWSATAAYAPAPPVIYSSLNGRRWFAFASAGVNMAKWILVADDNPMIRKMLCQLFEAEEDYDICAEAENGREAIDLAVKHRPDLIILDMSMPVMNGMEAARELKKIMPDVPIILFTQYENMGRVLLRIGQTVDRVVSKANPGALMEHVRSLAPA
jgi:DNA-binding NarL/FixJ family response regulator